MPLYDYLCEAGHRVEKREPFGSPAHQPCDKCGKPAHRLLNAPPILFKGSGWYSTDSGRTVRPGVNGEQGTEGGDDSADTSPDDTAAAKPAARKSTRAKASDAPAKPAARSAKAKPAASGD